MKFGRYGIECVFVLFLLMGAAKATAAQAPAASPPQAPSRAALGPEELDRRKKLLSSRVAEIYKLFQIPSWRKAEAYLTEDSRDIFYEQPKGPVLDFTIKDLEVAPDGMSAQASVEIKFVLAQFPTPLTMLRKTRWVYEQDNWFMKLERVPNHPLAPFLLQRTPDKNAVLRFPKLEQEISRGTREYVFPFENAGKETLSVRALPDDCGCMEASLDKESYAPGEKGELRVKMRIEEKAQAHEFYVRVYAIPGNHWTVVRLRLP